MNWISAKWSRSGVAAFALALFISGCSPHDHPGTAEEQADHGHAEGEKTAQILAFGSGYEIFAEHRPVEAGKPTKFVTHITDLNTLEPRREGLVRFELRLGEESPIEQIVQTPTRPGIYEPMLTFPKAGEWQVKLFVPSPTGEKSVVFPPVKVFADANETERAQVPEPPEGITFLKEQQWQIKAGTEPIAKRALVEQLRLPAIVAARPGNIAKVTAPLPGHVRFPDGQPTPQLGQKVEPGQLLALVQPSLTEAAARFVEAEAEVTRAKLSLDQAEQTFKRTEQLAKLEAKSARELQEAEFALRTAEANYQGALALQSTYRGASTNLPRSGNAASQPAIELRSPIGGIIVSQAGVATGEYITAEKDLFTVLDPSDVLIEAQVPEISVDRLGSTKSAVYELPESPGTFLPIAKEGAGRLVFFGIQVDPVTRKVPLIYEIQNREGRLRIGQAVNLYVETAHVEQALAIPNEAIVEEAGRPVAFVQVGGEIFQKRNLQLGIRDGNWVQVLAGLNEGERVVTKGAYAIRLASVSGALPSHGHAH